MVTRSASPAMAGYRVGVWASPSRAASSAHSSVMACCARIISCPTATVIFTCATIAPRERQATVRISPLGMAYSVPSVPRRVVVRSDMASTLPVQLASVTMSPTVMLPSIHRNMPLMISFTSDCAPKPRAMLPMPATARSEAKSTPKMRSTTSAMKKYIR